MTKREKICTIHIILAFSFRGGSENRYVEVFMLDSCLQHSEIYSNLQFSLPLYRLSEILCSLYPCGYEDKKEVFISLSYNEIKDFLFIYDSENSDFVLQEVVRYAAVFGLIKDLIISPVHMEWTMNPYHKRDLFFALMKFNIRESNKYFLSL